MAYNQPPPSYGNAQNYPENHAEVHKQNYGYNQPPPPAYGYGQPPAYGGDAAYPPPQAAAPATSYSTNTYNDYYSAGVAVMNAASFTDKAIRRAFVKKVYLILTCQLLVTVAFIAVFLLVDPVRNYVQTDGLWLYIVAYVTFLITYIVLVCCKSVRRNYPGNFICLAVFTVAFSFMTGLISSFHSTEIVLLAAGITAAVCISVSIFAIQTKIDFTMCSGLLFALLMVLFFFGWATLITYYAWGYNHILNCVYAGLGALVFALFLIYDTQMIMGGRKHEVSPEEYIYGALQLYIDVVYIFLFLLSIMGKNN